MTAISICMPVLNGAGFLHHDDALRAERPYAFGSDEYGYRLRGG